MLFIYQATAPEFKTYQEQVMKNAKVLADELNNRGYHLVSGKNLFYHNFHNY